jgi:predicted DNA-binding antitoxin AbrB/MazE fold protein
MDAVFEHGIFRPIDGHGLVLTDGQRVHLVVHVPDAPADILALAAQVYDGLAQEELDEIEQIVLDRPAFFGGRNPN